MQLRYKFFRGGDMNPFEKELKEAYARLTEERLNADPGKTRPMREVFPKLDSWADYVVALSKSTFWEMEREVRRSGGDKGNEIEELFETAEREGQIGEWLRETDADESEKALCFYLASRYYQFNPSDWVVDFRLYFTEGGEAMKGGDAYENAILEPYEIG